MEETGKLISFSEGAERVGRRQHPHRSGGKGPVDVRPSRETPPVRRWPPLLFILCFLAFGGAMATVFGQPPASPIGLLPKDVRVPLFERTLSEVASLCASKLGLRVGELREHCLGQARFLLSFAECDASCRATVAAVLPHSRR